LNYYIFNERELWFFFIRLNSACYLIKRYLKKMKLIDRIFITEALYNSVLKKWNFTIRYLGLFELRNITGMHKIYQVMTGNEK
jgi:hypothetical protein